METRLNLACLAVGSTNFLCSYGWASSRLNLACLAVGSTIVIAVISKFIIAASI